MKKSERLRQQKAKAVDRLTELNNLAKSQSRDLTADEQKEYDAKKVEAESLDAQIAAAVAEEANPGTGSEDLAAMKAELARRDELHDLALQFPQHLSAAEVKKHIANNTSAQDVKNEILAKLAKESQQNPTFPHRAELTRDARDTMRECMSAVLLNRLSPSKFKLDGQNEYRYMRPSELAKECLERAGVKTRGMAPIEWATLALQAPQATLIGSHGVETLGMMSTSDFPYVLANVNNKFMLAAYAEVDSRWRELSRQRNASDFKTQYPTLVSGAEAFELVGEGGEYKHGKLIEGRESYAVKSYGKIYAFTRQMLINDDMNAFADMSAAQGQAAGRTEGNLWWALVTGNPNMADGQPVFSAAHSNLIDPGTAISNDNLTIIRALISNQTGLQGEYLNIAPTFLVVPPSKYGLARAYTQPIQAVDPTKINLWTDLTPLQEARIGAGNAIAWYVACRGADNPPSIVHSYIDGQEGVYQESRVGFNPDGIEFKARLDFGCAWVSYRGWAKNLGA